MLKAVGNELFKIFAAKKIFAFAMAITLFSLLPALESALGTVEFTLNGQNLPLYMLASFVNLLIPIFIVVTLGDLITEEYVCGTLKLPLLHPVSRTKVLTAKLLALIVPVTILLLLGMITSYIIGTVIFGWGEQLLFDEKILSTTEGIMFTFGSYLSAVIPLTAFAALVMFLSLQFSSSGAAVATSVGLLVLLSIVGQIVVGLRPYLIITYFQELSRYIFFTRDLSSLIMALIVILIYGVGSFLASVRFFNKKEIHY